ncbi:MAG: anaerobic sulfatase maturase [Eubacteriales bacterium]|nr:anaerobic sulfatase maturase [Eubacteriales bacterium]
MPPVNILIKPASSACNMSCRYCFYKDVAQNREKESEGMLSIEQMENIICAGMEYADQICSFTFQGGEPTLAGLDFYQQAVQLVKKHRKKGVDVRFAMQTNGYAIDARWAEFLHENHFLVGLSLDGTTSQHNANRLDCTGKGTWGSAMRAAKLFDTYRVEYNILCVVTGENARHVGQIYRFYRKNNFRWLQFIPCLEPIGEKWGNASYHLSDVAYGTFLIRLFDLWFDDLKKGEYISIRHFDNWMFLLLGECTEVCSLSGICSIQFVVEADGGVYPCDFYVLDAWRLGTVGEKSFAEMAESATAREFIRRSMRLPAECKTCRWLYLCRNGCHRDRRMGTTGGKTIHCKAHQMFFEARGQQLLQAAHVLMRVRNKT